MKEGIPRDKSDANFISKNIGIVALKILFIFSLLLPRTWSDIGKYPPTTVRYQIDEEVEIGTVIGNVFVDSGLSNSYPAEVSNQFAFHILAQKVPYFHMDLTSSRLSISTRLDREDPKLDCQGKAICEVWFDIALTPAEYFRTITIIIEIIDINDNPPTFKDKSFELKIPESTPIGNSYALPTAVDPDNPMYGVQRYSVQPEFKDEFKLFMSVRPDGVVEASLSVEKALDRETTSSYNFTLLACESTVRPQCGSLNVHVEILDSNDNKPIFEMESYTVNISENTLPGSTILTLKATDADSGKNGKVEYVLSEISRQNHGDTFSVEIDSGKLTVTKPLDRETRSMYRIVVIGRDQGADQLHSEVPVTVFVEDENDNPPIITTYAISLIPLSDNLENYKNPEFKRKFFNTATFSPSVEVVKFEENSPIGSFIVGIGGQDKDIDANNKVVCSQNHPLLKLVEDPVKHRDLSVSYRLFSDAVFDVEDFFNRYELPVLSTVITCQDVPENPEVPSLTSNTTVYVYITDANDFPPRFTQTTYFLTRSFVKSTEVKRGLKPLFTISATDDDVTRKNSRIFFTLNSSSTFDLLYVSVDPSTGEVFVKADDHLFDNLNILCLTVNASDTGNPSLSTLENISLIIDAPADANDLIFTSNAYNFHIEENLVTSPLRMTKVGQIIATNVKGNCVKPPININYRLLCDDPKLPFIVDPKSGIIFAIEPLDRERQAEYKFHVIAEKVLEERRVYGESVRTSVAIYVIDLNDNAPIFVNLTTKNDLIQLERPDAVTGSSASHAIFLSPDHPLNEPLFRVSAFDADEGSNGLIRYKLKSYDSSKTFHMNPETGEVHLRSRNRNHASHSLRDILMSHVIVDVMAYDSGPSKLTGESRIIIILNESSSIQTFKERFIDLKNSRDPFVFDYPLASKKSPEIENESSFGMFHILVIVGVLTAIIVVSLFGVTVLVLRSRRKAKKRKEKFNQEYPGDSKTFNYRKNSSDKEEKISEHLVVSIPEESSFDLSHHSFNFDSDLSEDYSLHSRHPDVTMAPLSIHHHPLQSTFYNHSLKRGSRFSTIDSVSLLDFFFRFFLSPKLIINKTNWHLMPSVSIIAFLSSRLGIH